MPTLILIFSAILGLILGSFANVLIHRIKHQEKGIFTGRSHCPKCKHLLNALDLIPVFSYLFLRGKCHYCRKKISIRYPIVELSTAAVLTSFAYKFLILNYEPLIFAFYVIFGLALIFTFFYDLFYLEISDLILIPAFLLAFGLSFYKNELIPDPKSAIIGALIPVIFFLIQIIISKGKWVGGGDLRIGAFMGAMLGWQKTSVALILSYLIGSVVAIVILSLKKANMKTEIPFGPFLVLSTLICVLWGQEIIDFYIKLVMIM
ncbi:hypothetical protein A2229_01525 [Candidatus Peregrinibacteria bacterium RIFOXYA2_FULL_33_7]|nr:MAG: hypothetical protein A2229_01525 [Candidatus Peregrinibacteria bacterium RIFOXYA2_FULL_33_7]